MFSIFFFNGMNVAAAGTCVFIRRPVVLQTLSVVPPHQCIIVIREALLAEFYQVWKLSASVGGTAALLVVAGALAAVARGRAWSP